MQKNVKAKDRQFFVDIVSLSAYRFRLGPQLVRADQMMAEIKRFGFSGPEFLVTKHYNAWKTDFQQAIGQALNKPQRCVKSTHPDKQKRSCRLNLPARYSMLDTGYLRTNDARMVQSKNIEYPETSIETQSRPAGAFDATV